MGRRYSKAQLNAISRSYTKKREKVAKEQSEEQGLNAVYELQKTYKTLPGFLKGVNGKTEKGKKALKEAKAEAERLLKVYPADCWKRPEKTAVVETVNVKLAEMSKITDKPKVAAKAKAPSKPKATKKKTTPKKTTAKAPAKGKAKNKK